MKKGFAGIAALLEETNRIDNLPQWLGSPHYGDCGNDWLRVSIDGGWQRYVQLSTINCIDCSTDDGVTGRFVLRAEIFTSARDSIKDLYWPRSVKYLYLVRETHREMYLCGWKNGRDNDAYISPRYANIHSYGYDGQYDDKHMYRIGEFLWWFYTGDNFYHGRDVKDKSELMIASPKSADMNENKKLSLALAKNLFTDWRIYEIEVGTLAGLQTIHRELFAGLADDAGQIRTQNITKGNFRLVSAIYLKAVLDIIEKMPETTYEEIVSKYVEMEIVHPFMNGNGWATRLWLDMMLRRRLGVMVDWARIDKQDYMLAMERSSINELELRSLLQSNITIAFDNYGLIFKCLEKSYSYE